MIIGVLIGSIQPKGLREGIIVDTPFGQPSSPIFRLENGKTSFRFVARHGSPPSIPPHKVNHKANIWALKESGAEAIISICSTGALSKDIQVPSYAIPEDYIELSPILSFHDETIHHATPSLDKGLMNALSISLDKAGANFIKGGTYIQTSGPRLETRAEVRMISSWGDYIGMNMASEATLCIEIDIPVAGLISIDNYAHGIGEKDLDFREILTDAGTRWETVNEVLMILSDFL
jgi:5'-methylthioadenosine phosphorylase